MKTNRAKAVKVLGGVLIFFCLIGSLFLLPVLGAKRGFSVQLLSATKTKTEYLLNFKLTNSGSSTPTNQWQVEAHVPLYSVQAPAGWNVLNYRASEGGEVEYYAVWHTDCCPLAKGQSLSGFKATIATSGLTLEWSAWNLPGNFLSKGTVTL